MTSTGEWYFTLHLSLPLHHIIVITNACLFSKLVMNLPTPSGTVNSSQTTNTEATKIGPGDINSNTTNNATGKRGVGGSCPQEKQVHTDMQSKEPYMTNQQVTNLC